MQETQTNRIVLFSSDPEVSGFMYRYLLPETEWQGDALAMPDVSEIASIAKRMAPDVVFFFVDEDPSKVLILLSSLMIGNPVPVIIIARDPGAVKVVVLKCLHLGAVDVIVMPKPGEAASHAQVQRWRRIIESASCMHVKRVSSSCIIDTVEPRSEALQVLKIYGQGVKYDESGGDSGGYGCVGVAISTGGPQTLGQFLPSLPEDFPAPVLVVQHIIKGFIDALSERLDRICKVRVKIAEHCEPVFGGTVYIAPDSKHLKVSVNSDGIPIAFLDSKPEKALFRPCADVLFDSMAEAYGKRCIGVMMTGMGKDGVEGLKKMKAAGAYVIAQDKESSVIFGMARVAIEKGLVDRTLPVSDIVECLSGLLSGGGVRHSS